MSGPAASRPAHFLQAAAARRAHLTTVKFDIVEKHSLIIVNPLAKLSGFIAVGALVTALLSTSATAQHSANVDGLIVNLGIVPAEIALRAEGHRDSHPANPPPGSQHILVTVDEAKSGKRIGDAEVVVTVTDPRGKVSTKPLLHTQAGGLADYSELFAFVWSGRYAIRVAITRQPGAKAVEARFTVEHTI